jgi:hypothetical protein
MIRRLLLAAILAVAPGQASADQHHFKFMQAERIGGLAIGTKAAEIGKHLSGQPVKSAEKNQAADGMWVQRWVFKDRGVTLGMESERRGGAKRIASITCEARCTLKTARGIGVGSPAADAIRAYAAEHNKEDSKPSTFVAGSIYGGLILELKDGKVTRLFLGAAAE